MSVETLNPEGLAKPAGFAQVSVSRGSRFIQIAGQVGQDASGTIVAEGDLTQQTAQALVNVNIALEAADAGWDDVTSFTIYVVGWEESKFGDLAKGFGLAAEKLGVDRLELKPSTLVGVQALASPVYLVEIAALAVAD
ncbi:MAG: RidA family protein [Myxococcota bacterium]